MGKVVKESATISEKTIQNTEYKKLTLERLQRCKSERLVIKANDKGKNKVMWSQFDIAYLDGEEQQYARCKHCKCFVKYSARTGTGGLMRHHCYKKFSTLRHKDKSINETFEKEVRSPVEQEKVTEKLQIEALIHQRSPRIGFVPNSKGKSDVWSQFQMITLDNEVVNFACCIVCGNVVTYVSRTGTGGMTRHKCQINSSYTKFHQSLENKKKENNQIKKGNANKNEVNNQSLDNIGLKTEEVITWENKKIKEENKEPEDNYWNEGNHERMEEAWDFSNVQDDEGNGIKIQMNEMAQLERVVQEKHLTFFKKYVDLLNMFQNDDFIDLAQSLINLGAECGRIDARKVLREKTDFLKIFSNTDE